MISCILNEIGFYILVYTGESEGNLRNSRSRVKECEGKKGKRCYWSLRGLSVTTWSDPGRHSYYVSS